MYDLLNQHMLANRSGKIQKLCFSFYYKDMGQLVFYLILTKLFNSKITKRIKSLHVAGFF